MSRCENCGMENPQKHIVGAQEQLYDKTFRPIYSRDCHEIASLRRLVSCNLGTGLSPELLHTMAAYLDENKIAPIVLDNGKKVYILKLGDPK